MTRADRRQARGDIERLRKAAERIGRQQDALDDALGRLEAARASLKIIHIWAKRPIPDLRKELDCISARAMDTLRLIGD